MPLRKAILIIEKNGRMTDRLSTYLRSQQTHILSVSKLDVILPLMESNDRVYTIILVDDDPNDESLNANLGMIRQWSEEVPIIISISANNPALEKSIRQKGIFYYHTEQEKPEALHEAVKCALDKAVRDNTFLKYPGGGRC